MTLLAYIASGVQSSFFDPGDNGFDGGDLSIALGLVLTICAVIFMYRKVKKLIRDEFADAVVTVVTANLKTTIGDIVDEKLAIYTLPIQPEANGGSSLPDVARSSDWTVAALSLVLDHLGLKVPNDPSRAKH